MLIIDYNSKKRNQKIKEREPHQFSSFLYRTLKRKVNFKMADQPFFAIRTTALSSRVFDSTSRICNAYADWTWDYIRPRYFEISFFFYVLTYKFDRSCYSKIIYMKKIKKICIYTHTYMRVRTRYSLCITLLI